MTKEIEKSQAFLPYKIENTFNILSTETTSEMPWGLTTVSAQKAWEVTQGENSVVCVLDTGIDLDHSEFEGRIVGYRNFTNDNNSNPDIVEDTNGHGTHVAGIVAGTNYGVAPKAKLLIAKVISDVYIDTVDMSANAIDWAIGWRGENGEKVNVINMSIEYTLYSDAEINALLRAIKRARKAGITVVVAAGNDGDGDNATFEAYRRYPAIFPEVVTVGNIQSDEKIYSNSNSTPFVDVSAPGTNILSAYKDGGTATMTGTSMASPHVAGMVALIYSAYKQGGQELTSHEAIEIIKRTTRNPISGYKFDTSAFGYGIVDFAVKPLPKVETLLPLPQIKKEEILPYNSTNISVPLNYIRPFSLWEKTHGEGIVIAVLSTGVDINHDSLKGQIIDGKNFTTENGGNVNDYRDTNGMGTLCAGIVASTDKFIGVAPNAKLIIGKIQNTDLSFEDLEVGAGLEWANNWVGPNGEKVDIILSTFTATTPGPNYSAWNNQLGAATNDRCFVTGVGDVGDNSASTIENTYPLAYWSSIIGVSALRYFTTSVSASEPSVSSISATHKRATASAIGENIIGPWLNNTITSNKTSTHYAAAYVAGALALVMSYNRMAGRDVSYRSYQYELQRYLKPHTDSNSYERGFGVLDLSYATLPELQSSNAIIAEPPVYPNTTPPVMTLGTVTYDSVTVSWDYIPDETDNVYYQLMRDGVLISESKWLQTFTDLSVAELTSYSYKVVVMNKAGLVTESNEITVNVPGRSIKILSQISLAHMKAELKVKGNSQDEVIEAKMEIAKDFIAEETFCTLEELDERPMAVGVFTRLVADLFYERMTTAQVKENPTYRAMLKRLSKVVV
ncbi:S8 family serine peptidase [Cytobacillus praedii]|uniref:S8 family serine peptidase n=1 Tax=Cytobacillus praedii TaxID=1742358 RepID=UPI002E1FF630|nr:S8 family serine peptidase [Cytobacillus praedii]MED3552532.1 S8 family serine peptidase [Cytobacillus praedii]